MLNNHERGLMGVPKEIYPSWMNGDKQLVPPTILMQDAPVLDEKSGLSMAPKVGMDSYDMPQQQAPAEKLETPTPRPFTGTRNLQNPSNGNHHRSWSHFMQNNFNPSKMVKNAKASVKVFQKQGNALERWEHAINTDDVQTATEYYTRFYQLSHQKANPAQLMALSLSAPIQGTGVSIMAIKYKNMAKRFEKKWPDIAAAKKPVPRRR